MTNAFILMVTGLWGYLGSETPSPTALIPVFAGALLLSFIQKLRFGSKAYARFSLISTALILVALIKPLTGALTRADSAAVYRIGFMMVSCAITVGFFVRSSYRKKRRAKIKVS
jgi:hypothetical protein